MGVPLAFLYEGEIIYFKTIVMGPNYIWAKWKKIEWELIVYWQGT